MTVLVTGATGSVGRLVVDHLVAAGADAVRALTVDPRRAALPEGVEVVAGSVRRPQTLTSALAGVDRMYLAPAPGTAREVLTLARTAGVHYVVDLSGEPESWWGDVTRAVEASGLPWTHLWPGDFMENTYTWAEQIRTTGQVREPFPTAASAPIAMDDVAAVAARLLLGPEQPGVAHWLTGPQLLTRVDLVRQLGVALGRRLEFVQVPRDEAAAVLAGVMGDDAGWYVDEVLGGSVGYDLPPTSTVEEVTGRPATTFAQWAAAHTDRFR